MYNVYSHYFGGSPMKYVEFQELALRTQSAQSMEATIEYLAESIPFIKKGDQVLICFAKDKPGSFGELMEKAVLRRGAVPVMVEKDWRWKTLLRLAFSTHASTIVATPLVILGLMKLARQKGTPLSIRRIVTASYPCEPWMIDGISKFLDCETWGCFAPRGSSVVAGFSCGSKDGIHLRDDVYGVKIVGEDGAELPEGEVGDVVLYLKDDPDTAFALGDRAKLDTTPCSCGCKASRLVGITHGKSRDPELTKVGKELMSWTSILDCRLRRGDYGVEMEIVTFAGEKLPKLPACARRVVRAWEPDRDEPFFYVPGVDKY